VQKVCIPGLHLSLGIFNRLWNLLEDACKEIDFQCVVEGCSDTSLEGFRKFYSLKMDMEAQQTYRSLLSEMRAFSMLTDSSMPELDAEMAHTQERVKDMVNNYKHDKHILYLLKYVVDDREDQIGRDNEDKLQCCFR